ncbi:cytochrome P450 [Tanacetum coccineum]
MSEEVVQPTLDVVVDRPNSLDVNSPNSIKSNPDLNMNLGLGTDVSDNDKELEDVFGSFERISQNVILGSQTNLNQDDCIDEVVAIRNIGEQLGFSFGPRSRDERSGCRFDIDEANVFSDFISRVGFFDFPLGGRRFTRFDQEGRKSSKLDRFMVSPVFFDFWKDAHVKVMYRSFSDHCPILLKVESLNFEPNPFSVFDKWIGNADFNAFILDFWNQALPSSLFSPDILLKNKLKSLRLAIKAWSCEQVSAQIQPKETLLGRLLDWDVRAENGLLSDVDIAKREEWLMDLGHIEQLRRDDIRQKFQIK